MKTAAGVYQDVLLNNVVKTRQYTFDKKVDFPAGFRTWPRDTNYPS